MKLLCSLLLLVISFSTVRAADTILSVPPRYMWGWGPGLSGYCGEVSFQTFGIFSGNYVSQELVRYAAGKEELLVAVNDEQAASALKFTFSSWNYRQKTPQYQIFSNWVKSHIDQQHVVAGGVYEKLPSKEGDPDYDHIVPFFGYKSDNTGKVLGLYFNDLWGNATRYLDLASQAKSRSTCTRTTQPSQPYDYCLPTDFNYGIALTGFPDVNSETYHTTLVIPSWTEPDWGEEDGVHAPPVLFTISANVTGLTSGTNYATLRFDTIGEIPSSGFLQASYSARFDFKATESSYFLANFDSFMSDDQVFYRTVKA